MLPPQTKLSVIRAVFKAEKAVKRVTKTDL
jgi:hypothetical protein